MGSRYGGLKQIDPVGPEGEFIIDYSVFDAIRAGFSRVVFVIRREMESLFREAIGDRFASRIDVAYAFQEREMVPAGIAVPSGRKKPWGTAHAALVSRETVPGSFVVINADDFYGWQSYRILADFLRAGGGAETARYALAGFRLANTVSPHGKVSRGICEVDACGRLVSVTERTRIERAAAGGYEFHEDDTAGRLSGDEVVSMNMWAFTPAVFDHLDRLFRDFLEKSGASETAEFFLPTAIDRLIRRKEATVDVLPTPDRWYGVTYPEDKPEVVEGIRSLIAAGKYPAPLWNPRPDGSSGG